MMWGPPIKPLTEAQVRAKVIHTCWRCNSFGKIVNMALGLCPKCIEQLRDPDFVKEFRSFPPPDEGQLDLQDRG